jgi:hypothetical protein
MRENKWAELFGSDWPRVKAIGSAIVDPEEKQVFWDTVREAKMADSGFSIYTIYPSNESAKLRAARECVEFVKNLRRPKGQQDVS